MRVEFSSLKIGKTYCLVEKTGLFIPVGKLLEYKNMSKREATYPHEGGFCYIHKKQHLVFEDTPEYLVEKLNMIDMDDFYEEYVGLFNYEVNDSIATLNA